MDEGLQAAGPVDLAPELREERCAGGIFMAEDGAGV